MRCVFNLMVYIVVDGVYSSGVRDGSTVGPEPLLGTQAGLRKDIMSGLVVMGIGHLRGKAVQGRKKPRGRRAGPL